MEARPDAIVIATCRRTAAGGKFQGSIEAEMEVLRKATEAGCPAMDVAMESAEAMSARGLGRASFPRRNCALQPRL